MSKRGKFLSHIFSFLTCIFSEDSWKEGKDGKKQQKKEASNSGEKICGKIGPYSLNMRFLPLKIITSGGNFYPTNNSGAQAGHDQSCNRGSGRAA
jgi:hypothetical protein